MLKGFNRVVVFLFSVLFVLYSFTGVVSVNLTDVETLCSNADEFSEVPEASENSDTSVEQQANDEASLKAEEADVVSDDTEEDSQPDNTPNVGKVSAQTSSGSASHAKSVSSSSNSSVKKTVAAVSPASDAPVVKTPFYSSKTDIYMNYSSAAEEFIAKNLIAANSSFSVDGHSSLYSYDALVDTFKKVVCQNPYVLGVKSYTYSEVTHMVNVNYTYDAQTIKSKQASINSSANKIIKNIIGGNMSETERTLAIYNYLQSNASYNDAAADYAAANGFVKTSNNSYEDSFNTYGIIVNKNGVCMSYAYAFKILCDMADVTCVYVTGTLNGTPHMWNMTKIDGNWYHVDPTNNKSVCGIPYKIFNAPASLASANGYVLDNDFILDSEVSSYRAGTSYSYEYYTKNGLVADSFSEYKSILSEKIQAGFTCVFVRLNATYDRAAFTSAVKDVFTSLGMGSKLNSVNGKQSGQYLVVSF